MGAYNTLVGIKQTCSSCSSKERLTLQFKYGETWQHQYVVGDKLFGGSNNVGNPNFRLVVIDAVSEGCPKCGFVEVFIVVVEDNRIQSVELNYGKYDFLRHNESFIVIE